jgi:hypothetical protein
MLCIKEHLPLLVVVLLSSIAIFFLFKEVREVRGELASLQVTASSAPNQCTTTPTSQGQNEFSDMPAGLMTLNDIPMEFFQHHPPPPPTNNTTIEEVTAPVLQENDDDNKNKESLSPTSSKQATTSKRKHV